MRRTTLAVAVALVAISVSEHAPAAPAARATRVRQNQRPRYGSFVARMYSLREQYRGFVHIATKGGKPAIFINTDFGVGQYENWSEAQKARFQKFRSELLAVLGTNTLQLWNPVGDDWLHVGMGTGGSRLLDQENKGQTLKLYDYHTLHEFEIPTPGTERTTVLVKLTNPQLAKYNTYLRGIKTDFYGTLGETEYNGGIPPYVSGRPDGTHNCTSWMTSWLTKEVDRDLRYGADPPSWCRSTARGDAQALRGILVFNHPNAPHTGEVIDNAFPLKFE
jgi:hypothetical protein